MFDATFIRFFFFVECVKILEAFSSTRSNMIKQSKFKYLLALEWNSRLGDPLDEIVLFSVHIFYVLMLRCNLATHDVIRELGNRCHAGLLYFQFLTFLFLSTLRIKFCKRLITEKLIREFAAKFNSNRLWSVYLRTILKHSENPFVFWYGSVTKTTTI